MPYIPIWHINIIADQIDHNRYIARREINSIRYQYKNYMPYIPIWHINIIAYQIDHIDI